MSETAGPDNEPLAALVDPTAEETGLWPRPETPDASSTDSPDPRPELASVEPGLNEPPPGSDAADIPPQGLDVIVPPPAGSADATPRILASLSQLNTLIDNRLNILQTLFDREVRAEATRERIVDRLHAELQEYKQDFLLKVQRPIFIDLIQLHDDIGKMIEAQPDDDPDRGAAMRGTLESIRTAIEDTLYRQGVEPFQNEGALFDPRRQRSVTTVPTDDPERNKTIAGRLRPGFQAGDKVIRPEIVSVHILKK